VPAHVRPRQVSFLSDGQNEDLIAPFCSLEIEGIVKDSDEAKSLAPYRFNFTLNDNPRPYAYNVVP